MPSGWRARTATDHGSAGVLQLSRSSDAWASRVSRAAGAALAGAQAYLDGVLRQTGIKQSDRPMSPASRPCRKARQSSAPDGSKVDDGTKQLRLTLDLGPGVRAPPRSVAALEALGDDFLQTVELLSRWARPSALT